MYFVVMYVFKCFVSFVPNKNELRERLGYGCAMKKKETNSDNS